jgi:hypothetical protein
MKKLLILLALAVASCETIDQEKDIRVYYQDGTTEDITISTKDMYPNQIGTKEAVIYFNDGCLYTNYNESKYEAHFTGCLKCGVKDYAVLDVREIKEKE